MGFRLDDIRAYSKTLLKAKCTYCKKVQASIKCGGCRRRFHLNCGEKNRCQNQFAGKYLSFCDKHVQIEEDQTHPDNEKCLICWKNISQFTRLKSIPLCCYVGWCHRDCIRGKFLEDSYFKCPLCKNNDAAYRQEIRKRGVFALLSPYERCTASDCKCKEGSEHIEEDGNWSIIVCTNCEVKGVHVRCREDNVNPFVCSTCPKNG